MYYEVNETTTPLTKIRSARNPLIKDTLNLWRSHLVRYIVCVTKLSLSQTKLAIPISNISRKCIHVPIKGQPNDYLIVVPNQFEVH